MEPKEPSWWTIITACWRGNDLTVCPRCLGHRTLQHGLVNRGKVKRCPRCEGRGWLFVV